MIENIDQRVGEMISVVEQRGELDNTLIVYGSDHGEMLGDHNRWAKRSWYQPSVGVPLIVAGPGVRSGVVAECPVAIHDLAPTFLEFAGAAPIPEADAVSLSPFLTGSGPCPRRFVFSGFGTWRMVADGRYKLVLRESEAPLLYDLANDPWETTDVAASHPDLVGELSERIEANESGEDTGTVTSR
jgi:arylsulfatase A-like enzyme